MSNSNNDHLNAVVKSSVWYTISNFLLKGIGFLTVPLFARLMTKTELGDYTNFLLWQDVLGIFVSLGLTHSINRSRFDFPEEFDQYCCSILLYGSISTAVFYGVFCAYPSFFSQLIAVDVPYIHLMFIYLLVSPAFGILLGQQRIFFKYKTSVFLSVLSTVLTTGTPIIMILFMEDRLKARIIGYTVPWVLICIPVYILLVSRGKSFQFKHFKYAFLYSWPFIPHLLSTKLLNTSDMLMIRQFCGSEYVALYSIGHSCCTIITILATSINTAVSPWIFDTMHSQNYQALKKITLPYGLLMAVPCVGIMLMAPEVLLVLGGSGYVESQKLLVPLMASIVFQYMYFLYVNVEQYTRKTWAIAAGTAIAAVINIALNYVLIPRLGYEAAAYTTLIGYILLFIIHFVFVTSMGYKHLYEEKYIFAILAVVLALIPLIRWLYNFTWLRYGIAFMLGVACVVFAYKKKDVIMMLLRGKKKGSADSVQ